MPHIHTKPGQHDHTISLYIFRVDLDEQQVLLHLHRKIGKYAQFGGHIELHENPWQAAVHELEEETGYSIDELSLLQPHDSLLKMKRAILHPQPVAHATMSYPNNPGHKHTDSAYAFTALTTPQKPPQEGESTDLRWFTRAEVAQLNEVDDATRELALYVFDSILDNWRQVAPHTFEL